MLSLVVLLSAQAAANAGPPDVGSRRASAAPGARYASFSLLESYGDSMHLRRRARGWSLSPAEGSGWARRVVRLPPAARRVRVRAGRALGSWRVRLRPLPSAGGPGMEVGLGDAVALPTSTRTLEVTLVAAAAVGPVQLDDPRLDVEWSAPGAPPPTGPATQRVAPRWPQVLTRVEWGAEPPREAYDPHRPEAIVIHHAYIPNHARYYRVEGAECVAGIQRFHKGPQRGWNDVGYHYLIGPDGLIFAARPPEVIGAHAVPNTGKIGICMIGNHDPDGDPVTDVAWAQLEDLVTALCDRYDIPVSEQLYGHRDFSPKSCPGDRVYHRFDQLRATVRARLGTMGAR